MRLRAHSACRQRTCRGMRDTFAAGPFPGRQVVKTIRPLRPAAQPLWRGRRSQPIGSISAASDPATSEDLRASMGNRRGSARRNVTTPQAPHQPRTADPRENIIGRGSNRRSFQGRPGAYGCNGSLQATGRSAGAFLQPSDLEPWCSPWVGRTPAPGGPPTPRQRFGAQHHCAAEAEGAITARIRANSDTPLQLLRGPSSTRRHCAGRRHPGPRSSQP